jgi:hypothetical protein
MDERLEKALDFANYRQTLANQKRNIRTRMQMLQSVHYNNGSFLADTVTIGFINSLLAAKRKSAIVLDTRENPIKIDNLQEFQDLLIEKYTEATNEYTILLDKVNKARNIKKLMDW